MNKIKNTLILSLLIFGSVATLSAQKNASKNNSVQIVCRLSGCPSDSLGLYIFEGIGFRKVQSSKLSSDGSVIFNLSRSTPKFYFVGSDEAQLKSVLVGEDASVVVTGLCTNAQGMSADSPMNAAYSAMIQQLNTQKTEFGSLIMSYRNAGQNAEQIKILENQMLALDQKKIQYLDSLKKTQPFLAKTAALNTYLSYQGSNRGKYGDELQYFTNEYLGLADWKDAAMNDIPAVRDQVTDYVRNVLGIGLPEASQKSFFDALLFRIPEQSNTYRLALAGIVTGLMAADNNGLTGEYIGRYVTKYKNIEQSRIIAALQAHTKRNQAFTVGGEAPDFTLNTIDDKPLKMSSLRGKILLIDFWASWCGPCRRENPNVVALYGKYKNKGFEILGVSLDQAKDRWQQAIDADGLTWKHVSDLKGWQNEVAALYGVRSIPQTVLLDKEGKIIARNLRGEDLAKKLEELMGK